MTAIHRKPIVLKIGVWGLYFGLVISYWTHLPLDKMAAFSQTIVSEQVSEAFSWLKSFLFWLKFHWSLFLRVLSIGLDIGLVSNRRQAIIWPNADPIHLRIYAALLLRRKKNGVSIFHFNRRHVYSHRSDVVMSAMASQITGVWIVWSTVCSSADQRKYQSYASLAFMRWIHR